MHEGEGRDAPGDVLAEVATAVADWQATHPQASLAEMEAVVEGQLGRVRSWLVGQAITRQAAAVEETCARCSAPLVSRGTQVRTLRVPGDGRLRLTRAYATCPDCDRGLFPPG